VTPAGPVPPDPAVGTGRVVPGRSWTVPEPGTPPPRPRPRHLAARRSTAARLRAALLSTGRLKLATAAVAVAAVVVAVVAIVVAARPDPAPGRSAAAAGAEGALLAWAGDQLPSGVRLAADPELSAALRDAGAGPALLTTAASASASSATPSSSTPSSSTPSSSTPPTDGTPALAVTTGSARAGGEPLARFGSGDVALRVGVPDPVRPTADQVARRQELATALLANPQTTSPETAAGLLREGRVDPRLVWLIAGITAQAGVGVADLPAVTGEDDGVLRRVAVLDEFGGSRLADDPAALDRLRTWLGAQRAPLAPDSIEPVDGGLRVAYRWSADPDGLVDRAAGR